MLSDSVERCAEVLMGGGIAVIPTDTVYGVAASAEHPEAIARLYMLKGRPYDRPIPILVSSIARARSLSRMFSPDAAKLAGAFWPGALTIVVEASEVVPAEALSGGTTVGLRMPDHMLALELIERCGGALAVTSANRSGEPETRTASDAADSLGPDVDIVLDGGMTSGGTPSTVVDVTHHRPRIVRRGAIVAASIHRVTND